MDPLPRQADDFERFFVADELSNKFHPDDGPGDTGPLLELGANNLLPLDARLLGDNV